MKNELVNKINKLFPEFTNISRSNQYLRTDPDVYTDGNGNYLPSDKVDNSATQTLDLFTKLSDKWFNNETMQYGIIGDDVIQNVEEINIGAGCPVVNIETFSGINAKVDGHNFDSDGGLGVAICQVRLHRFHADFKLYDTDIMYGYGLENKAKAAMQIVMDKIQESYLDEITGANSSNACSPIHFPLTAKGIAKYAGCFTEPGTLYVRAGYYAELMASSLGQVDLTQPGACGWERIVKVCGENSNAIFAKRSNSACIGVAKNNIVGVAGVQAFDAISAFAGGSVAVRDMGRICGIPFTAIFSFDPTTFAIRCTVQAWAGFATPFWTTRYAMVAEGEDVTKVEVTNTTSNPVNTKAVS